MLLATALNNIGNKVIYKAGTPQQEEGVITEVRVAADYIMVRYGADVNSKATRPEDLEIALMKCTVCANEIYENSEGLLAHTLDVGKNTDLSRHHTPRLR